MNIRNGVIDFDNDTEFRDFKRGVDNEEYARWVVAGMDHDDFKLLAHFIPRSVATGTNGTSWRLPIRLGTLYYGSIEKDPEARWRINFKKLMEATGIGLTGIERKLTALLNTGAIFIVQCGPDDDPIQLNEAIAGEAYTAMTNHRKR